MKDIVLRKVDPENDFGWISQLFAAAQGEIRTEGDLKKEYASLGDRMVAAFVAEGGKRDIVGFGWAVRSHMNDRQADILVMVRHERRKEGIGRMLYEDLEKKAAACGIKRLEAKVRDDDERCRTFAERCGFSLKRHSIGMTLDISRLDDRLYDKTIAELKAKGFMFTTMEALGDDDEAQRKLYELNETSAMDIPGSSGGPSWLSFEDFREAVCGADWYDPAGQFLAIESRNGTWAAMSAITRFRGTDYAYNLYTGVDRRYRGQKLGQSVKVLALRYARDTLHVDKVRTNHNEQNFPMIAIDTKLGYERSLGYLKMVKEIAE